MWLGADELDPTRPKEELLEDLKEAIDLVSTFLTESKLRLMRLSIQQVLKETRQLLWPKKQ